MQVLCSWPQRLHAIFDNRKAMHADVQPKVSAMSAVVSLLFRKTATGTAGLVRFPAQPASSCELYPDEEGDLTKGQVT